VPISRRAFLKLAGAGAAATSFASFDPLAWMADASPRPIPMAMHVHSSFSEGTGSMFWQLDQAKRTGVEVVWWTDHDFRMSAWQYRKAIHCSGTSEPEDGHALTWSRTTSGSLQVASATFLAAASSPGDPDTTAGLRLDASSTSSSFASVRMTAQDAKARHNLHASLAGQSIVVDMSPESIGPDAFLELRVQLSDQPASGGRTSGSYYLYYRVGGPNAPGSVIKQMRGGTITYAAPTGAWTTLVLTPANDIARLWPDLQATDAALCQLSVAAGSRRGARAAGNIDNIRFQRTTSGSAPLQVQRTIGDALAPQFPGITQHQGLEVSLYPRHLNWYGGTVVLPDYGTADLSPVDDLAKTRDLVRMVHDGGGLASYNHMFGTGFGMTPLSTTKQETARINIAKQLVQNAAFGADILEVGYRMRGGVTLDRHLSVWDVCSRNGLFLTGNGVNDSHEGAWSGSGYTFVTSAWAEDAEESSLVGALAAGRCMFHDQDRFRGTLDLTVDGTAPMGSVSVASLSSRRLTIAAAQLPAGGSVAVVQGPVDRPGPTVTSPGTTRTTIPAGSFDGGAVSMDVDTSADRFVRTEILDSTGLLVAGSNPVWLLRTTPASGIPPSRGV
jgi:hypothetical protein